MFVNRKSCRRRGESVSTCSRGMWRVPVPPTTKNGARSKQAKEFVNFLRDLVKDPCWSILCMQEFTSSNGELVTETTEGHQVFATPPCPGQRRLAIVADVCWERKKFRVICSHLNPGSVGHMYARDLEDLSKLVTTRLKGVHVHICVDSQTGLGTEVLGPPNSIIGTAATITHRAENRDFLSALSWNTG